MIRKGATMLHSPAVWMPEELAEAWKLIQHLELKSQLIAGGTFLQTYWQKGLAFPTHLISLERVKELQGWGKELVNGERFTRIGALTKLTDFRKIAMLKKEVSLLDKACRSIAAPAIRNQATIGGNIATGLGDTIPALLALDAQLSVFDGEGYHLHSVSDYIKNLDSLSYSILVSIYLPDKTTARKTNYFYQKLGLREAFSPSVVTIAGCCTLDEQLRVEHIRLAVGGGSAIAQRLRRSEQLLSGSSLSNQLLTGVVQAIKGEFNPRTDIFSSAEYKRTVAANLLVSELVRLTGSEEGGDTRL